MAEGSRLSDKEINGFLDGIDRNNNGYIKLEEVQVKLNETHGEIAPEPKPHHLYHEGRVEAARHKFVRVMMETEQNRMPQKDFGQIIRTGKVPSLNPEKKAGDNPKAYMKSMPWGRKFHNNPNWLTFHTVPVLI
jgi:hypothetical protein